MADQSTPLKNTAFTLSFTLYKNDGTIITNPGTYTKKVSIDGAAVTDIAASVTEEDTTYGQLSLVLSAGEMNGDVIWVYVTDDTAGTVPFTCSLYPAAGALASQASVNAIDDYIDTEVGALATAVADLPTNSELATALGTADDAVLAAVAALNDFDPATDVVAHVTLVDTTTTNTDMRGTDGANTVEPDNAGIGTAALAALAAQAAAEGNTLAIGTPLQADDYTAPDNTGIGTAALAAGAAELAAGAAALAAEAAQTAAEAIIVPSAEDNADAVWDEAIAGHAVAGSTGARLAAAAAAGDPWSAEVPGEYEDGTAGALLPDLQGALSTLGAASVTVTSPVATSGTITIEQGDSYPLSRGRQVALSVADSTHALLLDDPTCDVYLRGSQFTWPAASVTETVAGYDVVFEPTIAQTAALNIARQSYKLIACYDNVAPTSDDATTIARGTVALNKDIPAVT